MRAGISTVLSMACFAAGISACGGDSESDRAATGGSAGTGAVGGGSSGSSGSTTGGGSGSSGSSGTSGTSGSSGAAPAGGTSGSSGVAPTGGTSGSSGAAPTGGTSGSSGTSPIGGTGGLPATTGCLTAGGVLCTLYRWELCPSGSEPVAADGHLGCGSADGWCCIPAPESSCSLSGTANCVPDACTDCWGPAPDATLTCEAGRVCCVDNCW